MPGGSVALELAVSQEGIDGIAAAVPVKVEADLALGGGDDCSVSHDGYPFGRVSYEAPPRMGAVPVPASTGRS